MMKQFFDFDMDSRAIPVKEGDTVSLGSHEITFADGTGWYTAGGYGYL